MSNIYATEFSECCGAAVVCNFGESRKGWFDGMRFSRSEEMIVKERNEIKTIMASLKAGTYTPPGRVMTLDKKCLLTAITASYQSSTAKILEELGWASDATAKNPNSVNKITLWHVTL